MVAGYGLKILTYLTTVTVKLKLNDIALHDKSSQSYEASLAVRDHTVLCPKSITLSCPRPVR